MKIQLKDNGEKLMKKRNLFTRLGLTALCVAALTMVGALTASAEAVPVQQEVDVVWSKSDGIRPEIFLATNSAGTWSEPEMVTDDYYDNMHPVIDRDSGGTRWLFWTAYDDSRTEIRFTTGSAGEWEKSQPLADEMKSNTGPSAVIDKNDAVWVVWSASDGELDDIYYAVNEDGEWSESRILHEANEVPDTLPVVTLNDEEGMPSVTWKQLQGDKYVSVTSVYDGSEWSSPVVIQETDEPANEDSGADKIVLPDFISQSGMVFIRAYQN